MEPKVWIHNPISGFLDKLDYFFFFFFRDNIVIAPDIVAEVSFSIVILRIPHVKIVSQLLLFLSVPS